MKTVLWTPQPRQRALMSRPEEEALYGGAAGGGKTDCALVEALRQVHIPHYRALILRKTFPQLSDMIDRSQVLYRGAFPGARYNISQHVWVFPSGAKIYFGSMQHTKDRYNYQGKQYDFIDFDELTQFTWDEYTYMFSRNRPGGPGTRCYIRAQANPGGIGHGWVKERFITPAPPMHTITEEIRLRWPDGREEIQKKHRVFVPASVFDNKILLENDPTYLPRLAAMPESEKNALLYGNWDTFSGQAFIEWQNDPDHYLDRINTHVVDPFIIPREWSLYCGLDWGYARPFAVCWFAADHDGRLYHIREFYGWSGTPNEGVRMEPAAVAREIRRIEAEDPNLKDRSIRRIGDPAIWGSQGPESVGALMERERVYFEKGDNNRLSGKMQLHHRLRFDENGVPMLYVFSTCKNFIRTVPALIYDERNAEDIDTTGEDHIYDATRYVLMARTIAPPPEKPRRLVVYDPLSTEPDYGRYDWYQNY